MQIEGIVLSICSCRRIGAVLSDGAHIIDSSKARVDGRLRAARAGIRRVFDETLAGVVLFVGETCGGDGRAWCRGRGIGAGRGTNGCDGGRGGGRRC